MKTVNLLILANTVRQDSTSAEAYKPYNSKHQLLELEECNVLFKRHMETGFFKNKNKIFITDPNVYMN